MHRFADVYRVTFVTPAGTQTWLSGWQPFHDQILRWLDLPPDLYRHPNKIPASA
jgi:hypothetical protein